jgi:hypothetical protein
MNVFACSPAPVGAVGRLSVTGCCAGLRNGRAGSGDARPAPGIDIGSARPEDAAPGQADGVRSCRSVDRAHTGHPVSDTFHTRFSRLSTTPDTTRRHVPSSKEHS